MLNFNIKTIIYFKMRLKHTRILKLVGLILLIVLLIQIILSNYSTKQTKQNDIESIIEALLINKNEEKIDENLV
jgi:hypothetical protein